MNTQTNIFAGRHWSLLCLLLVAVVITRASRQQQAPLPSPATVAQKQQEQEQADNELAKARAGRQQSGGGRDGQLQFSVRILALFTGSSNDLGLDHRLGRQVLKLAAEKARRAAAGRLESVELIFHNDDTDCSLSSSAGQVPLAVARHFYLDAKTGTTTDWNGTAPGQLDQPAVAAASQSDCSASSSDLCNGGGEDLEWNGVDRASGAIDAILGPSCDHQIDQVARMAAYWRTPIYIVTPTSGLFARKDIYSTLTRLAPSIDLLSSFVVRVLDHFKWRHLAVVVDMSQTENAILVKTLDKTIDQLRYSIPVERKVFPIGSDSLQNLIHSPGASAAATSSSCSVEARETLEAVRRVARVVLILLDDPKLVRQLLLCAHELQFNNGEFAFLTLNLGFKSSKRSDGTTSRRANGGAQSVQVFDWFVQNDEENNLKARQMFESLMVFSVELPIDDEFNSFSDQVLELARLEQQSRNQSHSDQFESVGPVAVALHDSLLMAVEAKRRLLVSGGLSERLPLLWNESFTAGLMSATRINANGDQELNYVLSDLEPELGIMRPVATYSKNHNQLKLLANSYVHWPARVSAAEAERAAEAAATGDVLDATSLAVAHSEEEPPPDEPECGFTGEAERCIDRRNMYTALTIISLFLLTCLLILLISLGRYKRIKYQMQLDDYWWRINWSELEFIDLHSNSLHSKLGSNSVILLKRKLDGTSGSVVSSGHHSLASVANATPQALAVEASPKALSFIGDGFFKSIKRPSSGQAAKVSLVVTPAASGPDENKLEGGSKLTMTGGETNDDKIDRLSLTSGGSKTHPNRQPTSIRSDMSTVVRSSSLALYKDEVVIVKQLNGSCVEITRQLLIELKCIRELAHENLARLVGLCIERDHLASVYEYCSRGNLQDLLLNEDFHMDWDLKYSIIGDILNGLNFIHTTLLDYHGRLKSTNLVIDSRFTVKLTDFGLKSLYNQLELIELDEPDHDDSDSCEQQPAVAVDGKTTTAPNSAFGSRVGATLNELRGGDADFRRQSAVPTIYNMDSVSMRVEPNLAMPSFAPANSSQQQNAPDSASNSRRMSMKNHSSARFFWTAPEHLRQRQPHLAASSKGDIFSLAIVLYEIFTRKEPYYFGTNAKPRWPVIRREKLRHRAQRPDQQQQQQPQMIGFDENSAERMAARNQRRSSKLKSQRSIQSGQLSVVTRSSGSTQTKPSSSIFQRRKRRNQVAATTTNNRPLTPPSRKASLDRESCSSELSNRSTPSMFETAGLSSAGGPIAEQLVTECTDAIPQGDAAKSQFAAPPPPTSSVSESAPIRRPVAVKGKGSSVSSRPSRSRLRSGRSQESQSELPVVVDLEGDVDEDALLDADQTTRDDQARLDADEILDQLRMGVQPEPIRPYIPNFLLADIEPKLVELLRNCWHELPSQRPNAGQVRNSMRKITKGATAKNYLDNLLDRLQTYASQLERIVDFRSADILAEKMRTEELLYQLVPRFVADKLKQNEPIIPQLYDGVTIFFSDIVGFEKYASVMSPCEMVDLLNNINSSFEDIISSFDVTKIEVILDQFLVAAGISFGQQEKAAAAAGQMGQATNGGGETEASQQIEQGEQQQVGEQQSNGATRSRRGLLKSLRKTDAKMFKSSSLEGAKGKQNSLNDSQDRKFESNSKSEPNGHDPDQLYKLSGAEQIARMALCIRDLVKSFHFRQNLNSYSSARQTTSVTEVTDGVETNTDQQQQVVKGAASGSNFVATSFNIRIGIHSGKVCAGIVGLKRPKFCLIGDAVNVASRMHTNSKANKIQISSHARDLLKQVSGFNIIPRGQIEVKGKGLMETFWLESSY